LCQQKGRLMTSDLPFFQRCSQIPLSLPLFASALAIQLGTSLRAYSGQRLLFSGEQRSTCQQCTGEEPSHDAAPALSRIESISKAARRDSPPDGPGCPPSGSGRTIALQGSDIFLSLQDSPLKLLRPPLHPAIAHNLATITTRLRAPSHPGLLFPGPETLSVIC